MFLVILACIGVYSFQLSFRRKETLLILRSVYDGNVSEQLFRENSRLTERSLYMLLITTLVLVSTFATWWLGESGIISGIGIKQMLIGVVCAALVYVFRYTVLQLLGTLGNAREVIDQVVFDLKTILATIGFVALPLVTFAVFAIGNIAQVSGYVVLIILCLSFGLFLFKGSVVSLRSAQVRFLHLFYYFCALEIMPLIWAYRSLLN